MVTGKIRNKSLGMAVLGASLSGGVFPPAQGAAVTIEPVARSLSSGRDAVPGRPSPFVFRGQATMEAPVVNADGDVVFAAFSASLFNAATGPAFGIYLHEAGEPLRVLVDTTLDSSGNPVFPVPGQPAGTFFLNSPLGPPLLNNTGEVVFHARWRDPVAGFTGEGFYSINTTVGSPLVKIVDNTDAVPGHAAGQFFNFQFVSPNASRMAVSLNDAGEVVYWAQFCLEATCTTTNMQNGLFGSTTAGGLGLLLADSMQNICPSGLPAGVTCDSALDEGFWEIRPEKGLNNNGDAIFHGKIRRDGASTCCDGVFTVPCTGGAITTVAFRSQPAPPSGLSTFGDRFDEVAHNDVGTALFLPLLGSGSPQRFGIFSGDLTGGPHVRLADTIPGSGVIVPGDPPDGEFTSVVFPAMNDAGQVGFRAVSNNSADSNNHGIYSGDASDGTLRLVVDEGTAVPGLPAPAKFTSFQNSGGTAINGSGNLAFWGIGIDDMGALFRGIYFYDACTEESTRIADSSTAFVDLGANFGSSGTRGFDLYTAGEARAGQYQSMNNSNQVAFVTQFSNADFGIYVATVDAGAGGALSIACPSDVTVDCTDDVSPASLGDPVVEGCGTITSSFEDSSLPGCGGTQTITRTWSADNGAGQVETCDQIITTEDSTAPTLSVPADVGVECGDDTSPASTGSATAVDDCDASPAVTFSDWTSPGACGGEVVVTRTWTASDECGNSSDDLQFITTTDTTEPTITDLNGAPLLVAIGDPVVLDVTHADACASSFIVTWNWGDGNVDVVDPASSPISAAHAYAEQDIYVVTVDVDDGCGNVATESIVVVAYDPNDGFTTGGGWFIPDVDSYIDGVPVTNTSSKANFGFVVKYKNGASTPSGNIEFVYKAGDIDLHSLDMDWLVITSASKVRFKGLATINGEGLYTFKVTAEDNGDPGSNDTFKIEIWTGPVDTENGPPTPKHKAQGVLGGGNIKIHQ